MESSKNTIHTVLKAIAVAMAVASIVLGFLNAASVSTQVALLGIGLLALAVVALQNE